MIDAGKLNSAVLFFQLNERNEESSSFYLAEDIKNLDKVLFHVGQRVTQTLLEVVMNELGWVDIKVKRNI